MANIYTLKFENADILQILEALDNRAEAWEKTEATLTGDLEDIFFVAEECSKPEEAAEIARHFRDIATKIELQLREQTDPTS